MRQKVEKSSWGILIDIIESEYEKQNLPCVESDYAILMPRPRIHQPPFSPMYDAKPRFPRPFRQKQIPSNFFLKLDLANVDD
jgi:hypothetical protein